MLLLYTRKDVNATSTEHIPVQKNISKNKSLSPAEGLLEKVSKHFCLGLEDQKISDVLMRLIRDPTTYAI